MSGPGQAGVHYLEAVAHHARASHSCTVRGIPLAVDLSCVMATVLGGWTIADAVLPPAVPDRAGLAYAAGGAVAALLVVVSIVVHELAHATAARRARLGVRGMAVSIFGGATDLVRAPLTPGVAFRIAMAGPCANVLVAVIGAAVHVVLVETGADPLVAVVPAVVAAANAWIALVNLVPALPFDGGHVVMAIGWAVTGRGDHAHRVAASMGRALGLVVLGVAIVASASGDAALAVWLGLIGLVVWRDATPARSETPVADVVSRRRSAAAA